MNRIASATSAGYLSQIILFRSGFRSFFFLAVLWSGLSIPFWIVLLEGYALLPTGLAPMQWHVHEMVFGYVSAVLAGFLLTAVPNWTGRASPGPAPIAALAVLWLLGRLAIAISGWIGPVVAGLVDLLFPLLLAGWTARQVIAARNWRNLRVVALLLVFLAGDALFQITVPMGREDIGLRIGLSGIIGMMMLVGGRIIPAFTRNWLQPRPRGRMPRSGNRVDAGFVGVAAAALAFWSVAPDATVTGVLLLAAGLAQAIRLSRWAGGRTAAEILVLVLHFAYAFIPAGFWLLGVAVLWPQALPVSAALHAWTAGAIGLVTVAVMTRASLGHSGRPLNANGITVAVYACIALSALLRVAAPLTISYEGELHAAACLWSLGFLALACAYFSIWVRRPLEE